MTDSRPAWMSDDVALFQDQVRRIFEREFAPHEERWRREHLADRSIWRQAGEMGLLCTSIPEAYGGAGGTFAHEAVIAAEQARALVNSFSINVHSGIVAHYLLAYGSEEQKLRWLPKMARGELVSAIAMTEPGAGTDLQAVRTSARRDGDHYVLNGTKTFITNGHHADLVCVVVKTDAARGAKGVSLLMVEVADCPGFRRGRLLEKIGQHGQDTAELFFDEVRVPVENLLGGEEGQGFRQLMQQLPRERLLIAIGAVATMQRAVAETLAYVRERRIFGEPLLAMQNTRFKLAECRTEVAFSEAFVDQCIQRQLAGTLDVPTAAMAKWSTTQRLGQVIDECLQLHGGYGYMAEYPIARMYVDARVLRILGGANEVMKELIARDMEKAA
ncbi:acyl-CoA dehydrogenase family protein [Aquincola sp. S2]|uniref:Acyl-[acyl-carrier-protein] dehydrogenase MbtN n=1 Tax=Pseudaquabacterium terrae TaxID=2732868 RepID=A0ABX2EGB9_9BURK|nr:acyl-CoA dehydrogenase family protein [Aquabacterium terrae]NRF67679.1 acyl-CoA dehydrogenase family protein [Aquabacterium terrae]